MGPLASVGTVELLAQKNGKHKSFVSNRALVQLDISNLSTHTTLAYQCISLKGRCFLPDLEDPPVSRRPSLLNLSSHIRSRTPLQAVRPT